MNSFNWMFPNTPQIIHFNRVFHYKPSILGYPYFWKHPTLSFHLPNMSFIWRIRQVVSPALAAPLEVLVEPCYLNSPANLGETLGIR